MKDLSGGKSNIRSNRGMNPREKGLGYLAHSTARVTFSSVQGFDSVLCVTQ